MTRAAERTAFATSIRVVGGVHDGAECTLRSGASVVGAADGADIILTDAAIAVRHATLEPSRRELLVTAEAPGVRVDGVAIATGETVAATYPIDVHLGDVSLHVEIRPAPDPTPAGVAAAPRRTRPARLGSRVRRAAAAGCVALLVVVVALRATGEGPARALEPVPSVMRSATPPRPSDPGAVTDATLRDETRRRAALLGLSTIDVTASAGLVLLGGVGRTDEAARLHRLALWFDGRFGARAVLVSNVDLSDRMVLPIELEAVWDGPHPRVVIHGRTFSVGERLPDGSTLERIAAHGIGIRHDGQPVTIAY